MTIHSIAFPLLLTLLIPYFPAHANKNAEPPQTTSPTPTNDENKKKPKHAAPVAAEPVTKGLNPQAGRQEISLEESRKKWKTLLDERKKKTTEKGEEWLFPKCRVESISETMGRDRVRVWFEEKSGDMRKIHVVGQGTPEGENAPIDQFIGGYLSREVFPTTIQGEQPSDGEPNRSWVSRKWNGQAKLWRGKATSQSTHVGPYVKPFEYFEDGKYKSISTQSYSEGRSNAEHFRQDKVTVGIVFRFDNSGNSAIYKVEVDDKGNKAFRVRGTCGSGFGSSPGMSYQDVFTVKSPDLRRLLDSVVYTDKLDIPS